MASTPQPPAAKPPTPQHPPAPHSPATTAVAAQPQARNPLIDEHGVATRDGQKDPNPSEVVLVGQEQLARSEDMERKGIDNWKREHDTRDPNDRPKAVAGIAQDDSSVDKSKR
jgi:hypothetical protein